MSANVTSLDAVRAFRLSMKDFELDARDGLEMLKLEIQRAVDWIEHDRPRYWADQARKASDALIEANNELERCQMRIGSEEPRPCLEQKKAVEVAKRRLRETQEKVYCVKQWNRTVQQELNDFQGRLGRMGECIDTDVPRAIAALERMLRSLEKYTELKAPEPLGKAAPATPNTDAT